MKILIIAPKNSDAPSFYRSIGPFSKLQQDGSITMVDATEERGINWSTLMRYDILFIQRPSRPQDYEVINLASKVGIPIWVDYDDDFFNVSTDNPAIRYFGLKQFQEFHKKTLKTANYITVSTQDLKDKYKPYNENIKVLPNAVDERIFSDTPNTTNNLILYRGSKTHWVDLYSHTDQLLDCIESSFGWDWLFLGFNPWWIGHESVKQMREFDPTKKEGDLFWKDSIDLMYYFSLIKQLAPSVMIVPLANNEFNKAKSNIAWLEATMSGAVTIAPSYLPEFDQSGVLTYKDPDGFKKILSDVITKKVDLKKHHKESYDFIKETLTLDVINKQRLEIAKSLL